MSAITAISRGLAACHDCGLLVRLAGHHGSCPRCKSAVHFRKNNSLARTWALLITAYVLILPANIFPVMVTTSLGTAQEDTIMSGVIYLWSHGSWPLALLVFIASVFVPFAKLGVITYLLVSVQRGSKWSPVKRTRMYRIAEAAGRWSMVDIYVVTILTALVSLGGLATIEAGLGAAFFGVVVVTTMLAAESFDPRLIWDRAEA